jgi:hypothetical protein
MSLIYQVRFLKQIHSCFAAASSNDVYVFRDVELPFPPYPGLVVQSGSFNAASDSYTYDLKSKKFIAYTEPDKTLYDRALHAKQFFASGYDMKALEEVVKEWTDLGWKREQR